MPDSLNELPLILVSGQARSGTTILTRALGAHPQIFSNNQENVWVRDIVEVVGHTVGDRSRVRQMAVEPEIFVDGFRETIYRMLFPDSLRDSIEGDAINGEIKALSTFTSLHEETCDVLPIVLPQFKLVNIIRNGLEVVASRLKHPYISKAGDFSVHCTAWAHCVDVVRWFENHPEFKDRFFLIRHEQLLDADKCREVFGRVQYRFGLDRSEACAKFVAENFVSENKTHDGQSPQTTAGAKSRSLAWQSWDSQQRKQFEDICGASMKKFEYDIPWL